MNMYVKHSFTEKTGLFEAKSNILTQKVILLQLHMLVKKVT